MAVKQKTRQLVFAKKGRKCVYCGQHVNTVDHIIPQGKNGSNGYRNLVPACNVCNENRGMCPYEVWLRMSRMFKNSRSFKYKKSHTRMVESIVKNIEQYGLQYTRDMIFSREPQFWRQYYWFRAAVRYKRKMEKIENER